MNDYGCVLNLFCAQRNMSSFGVTSAGRGVAKHRYQRQLGTHLHQVGLLAETLQLVFNAHEYRMS
jgi:hypothetical protein